MPHRGKTPSSVDSYIEKTPAEYRPRLEKVRAIIRETAPKAREGISYKMPFYYYKGSLVWFANHSTYIGVYFRPPVVWDHEEALQGYTTTKSAVHLPHDRKIPVSLLKTLVKASVRMNEYRAEHQS